MIKKLLILFLFSAPFYVNNALAEPTNTYDSEGRVIKTIYDDGSYDEYYYYRNGSGYKNTYNAAGKRTGYYDYYTKDDFDNNSPGSQRLWTYDLNGNQTSEAYYWSKEAIENDIPDSKRETTYDSQNNPIAGANYSYGTLENKWTSSYSAEKNVWITESYDTPEALESNTPSRYSIYGDDVSIEYDGEGNLLGVGGDVFEYDDQGNISAYGWQLC